MTGTVPARQPSAIWQELIGLFEELGRTPETASYRRADLGRRIGMRVQEAVELVLRRFHHEEALEEKAREVCHSLYSGFPNKRKGTKGWTRPPLESLAEFILREPAPEKVAGYFRKCVETVSRELDKGIRWGDRSLEGSVRERLKGFSEGTRGKIEVGVVTRKKGGRETYFYHQGKVPVPGLIFDPPGECVKGPIGRIIGRHPPGKRDRAVQDNSFLDQVLEEIFVDPDLSKYAWSAAYLADLLGRHTDSKAGLASLEQPVESCKECDGTALTELIADANAPKLVPAAEIAQWRDESLREFQSKDDWRSKGQILLYFYAARFPDGRQLVPGLQKWHEKWERTGIPVTEFLQGKCSISYGSVTGWRKDAEKFLLGRFSLLEEKHGKGLTMFLEGLIGLLREPA